ncbi:MAG: hypothetical protein JST89_17160 [Cyanobacteria bacterium SZAS-4]|nr:hypothetical protein [Cyanobacteria bacterium SZAS-4]
MNTTLSEKISSSSDAPAKLQGPVIAAVISGLACLAMLTLSVWVLDKGFDLTDEGYYLLSHDAPHQYLCFTFVFHLVKLIPLLPGIDTIVQLRVMHLSCIISGAAILWWGVVTWGQTVSIKMLSFRSFRLTLLFLAISGNLLTNAFLPQTISYNGLTSFFVNTSAGILFAAIGHQGRGHNWKNISHLLVVLAGFIAGLSIFSKLSTGICVFAAEIVFLLVFSQLNRKINVAAYVTGFAASIAAGFSFVVSPQEFVTKLTMFPPDKTHTLPIMLRDYVSDLARNVTRGAVISIPLALFCFKKRFPDKLFYPVFALVAATVTLYGFDTSYLAKVNFYYLTATWCWVLYALNAEKRKKEIILGLVFLGLLPFVSAAGTNRELFVQASLSLGPWLLMSAIVGSIVSETAQKRGPVVLTLTVIFTSVMLAIQFFSGLLVEPYRNPYSLAESKYQFPNSRISGIKLDLPTLNELTEMRSLLEKNGFQKGDLIIAYEKPGLVYAISGQSVGLPWFNPTCPGANAKAIVYAMPKTPHRLFLIFDWANELNDETLDAFRKVGKPFPESFKLLGRPNNRFTHKPMFVYGLNSN